MRQKIREFTMKLAIKHRIAIGSIFAAFSSLSSAVLTTPAYADGLPKIIRFATDAQYPPFDYRDKEGKVAGFDVDISQAICKEMKVQCTVVIQSWDGIVPGLMVEKYDAILGIGVTEDRKKVVGFTEKYWNTPSRLLGAKGKTYTYTADGLANVTIGIERGTYQEAYAKDHFQKSSVRLYQSLDQAYLDLKSGRVDLVFAAAVPMLQFLKSPEGQNYEFEPPVYDDKKYFGDGVRIAVRKDDQALRELINEGIKRIRANGEYKKINDKNFPFDVYGQ
jgi:arginine/ornithine transport system substrate-binding protein